MSLNARELVYIVDDDIESRDAVQSALAETGHRIVTFKSSERFLATANLSAVGCVVTDYPNTDRRTANVVQELTRRDSMLTAIVVTKAATTKTVANAFEAGAFAFLETPIVASELIDRIRLAIARSYEKWRLCPNAGQTRARLARLTPSEREVLELISLGYHTKKIAATLGRSPNTVRVHRSSILRKLEAETETEVVSSVVRLKQLGLSRT